MTLTPIRHRRIPVLPDRPCSHPIVGDIRRSYPVGRQSCSRACQGKVLVLTLTATEPLPPNVEARLLTTLNSPEVNTWTDVPFVPTSDNTLMCSIIPERPGLNSFRAEFSLDGGVTWIPDTVPDGWVLIDPPQVEALRLYSVVPTVSGTIADWKADLKRIAAMGFNAVHLLPITTLDASQSPYAAYDLFSIDPGYLVPGSEQDGLRQLEEFIAEAKAVNIRLCFDLVLNHVGVHSKMVQCAPDWIAPDERQPDGFQRAGYWSHNGWNNWNDLVLINYEHPSEAIRAEIWEYMTDYALFWAKYANDTGGFVRFDNLHSSNPDFLLAVTKALDAEYPEVGLLAEYFTDENTLLHTGPMWGLNLILATPWNYAFVPQLRDYLTHIHRVSEHVRYLMPVTSHDSGSPAQEFGTADSTVPRYVAAALLGTGATGMPQGVEFGQAERINFIGRHPKMEYPPAARFGPLIGRVNAILANHLAFCRGGNCEFVDNDHHAIIAVFRKEEGIRTFGFLVVCNFDISSSQQITVDLTPFIGPDWPVPCMELLSGTMQFLMEPHLELTLEPCSAQVLRLHRNHRTEDDRHFP